jgi:hypothetical protein
MTLSKTTLDIMTLSRTTLSISTLRITTLSISQHKRLDFNTTLMTLSITTLSIILSSIFFIVKPNVILLIVILLFVEAPIGYLEAFYFPPESNKI